MQQQQYYPTAVPRHGEHVYHHPAGGYIHPATAARMQWSPNVQTGQWTYDISSTYPAGFVPSSMGLHSPDPQSAATPHNIRDILGPGGQQQQQSADTLQSEIAKTPSSYQKSPSSAGAATGGSGTVFHYPTPVSGGDMRSPTTPNHPAEIPAQFYIPALQGKPFVGFDPSALTPDNLHSIPGLAYYSGSAVDPKVGTPGGADKNSTSKDGKKEKKGRATFSGNQIDELEKVFNTNQYLTNQERHNLAERLSLSENQVKIWFQNRRTKCRRTSWKRPSSVTSPTTPTAPVSFGSTPTTPTQQNPPNPPPSTQ